MYLVNNNIFNIINDGMKKEPTETELRHETSKWLERLEKEIKYVKSTGKLDKKQFSQLMENIHAYISDCRYFSKKGDLVRAFEAVIYAWGMYETCLHAGIIEKQKLKN